MKNEFAESQRPNSSKSLSLIQKFSKDRRNEIRGALSSFRKNGLQKSVLEKVRNNSMISDMSFAGELIEGPAGLRGRKARAHTQKDLWTTYNEPDKSMELEVSYACGFLNSWAQDAIEAIETIRLLTLVAVVDRQDAETALRACAKRWGASNYLCYKTSFLKCDAATNGEQSAVMDEVDDLLGHSDHPGLQYSSLENMSASISLFSVARRHTNSMRERVGREFRRSHFLNNLVATPFSETDAAAFMHRAVETTLLDTVHALWVLLNLKHRFAALEGVLRTSLSEEIYIALSSAIDDVSQLEVPNLLVNDAVDNKRLDDNSEQIYRKSAAFLEYPALCKFRNDIDCVIGLRLVSSLLPRVTQWSSESFDDFDVMKRENSRFDLELHNTDKVKIDPFYRTYLFLRFIQKPINLSLLSEDEFKFAFNNTVELDALIQEHELDSMHLNASEATTDLVSVLALALHRSRSSDPDVDFSYRDKLERHILDEFNGSIQDFIDSMISTSPQVAHYLIHSLNDATVQKMYRLVTSPLQASIVRRDILLSIGVALNRIELIIEAEAIETRNKVSQLKKYFDTSRMYVDSIAMKAWLEANPSAYAREFKELLPKLVTRLAGIANVPNKATGGTSTISVSVVTSTAEHLVAQIAKEAFREFCTNAEFGIESYLGRRIRHNTLQGVMGDPIDGIFADPVHRPVIAGTRFGRSLDDWSKYYASYVEKIKKELLQFREVSKPSALFDPELNRADPSTLTNLVQLSETLKVGGSELLQDLVIAFCWRQIGPQLDYASRQFRVTMARDIKSALETHTAGFDGPEQQRVVAELDEAIDAVFSKVASWFRLPETGFVPATIGALCNIIDIEFGREDNPTTVSGNLIDTEYYGISVHRLYDCLAVLMQNAFVHGEFLSTVSVNVQAAIIPKTNLQKIEVSVLSTVDLEEMDACVRRIRTALASVETGRDMVTEGYSGLKKVKERLINGFGCAEMSA